MCIHNKTRLDKRTLKSEGNSIKNGSEISLMNNVHGIVTSNTLKSFINTVVWVQGHHHVANGTMLII